MKNKEIDNWIEGGPIALQRNGNAFPLNANSAAYLTREAGRQLIIDTIQAAANQQKYNCELKELSEENEAALKDAGYIVTRLEATGTINIKWQP